MDFSSWHLMGQGFQQCHHSYGMWEHLAPDCSRYVKISQAYFEDSSVATFYNSLPLSAISLTCFTYLWSTEI